MLAKLSSNSLILRLSERSYIVFFNLTFLNLLPTYYLNLLLLNHVWEYVLEGEKNKSESWASLIHEA